MRNRRPRLIAALLVSLAAPQFAAAQAGLEHLDDLTLPPRGLLRVRVIAAWTRIADRFGPNGPVALGFTADSVGSAQIVELDSAQTLMQGAAALPLLLSLGAGELDAVARTELTPLTFEYGLSRRFSVSATVPHVRKRVAVQFRLDSLGANMGPNPHRLSSTASQNNGLVQSQFQSAASQLQTKLQSCQSAPAGPGCAALLPRTAEAQALIQSSNTFAATVANLYGNGTNTGQAFVPRTASAAQTAIATRVADFNSQYRDLLASSTDLVTAIPSAALLPAGVADVQRFLVTELGGDSLTSKERLGPGDMELGMKFLAVDRAAKRRGATRARVVLGSSVRLPTGSRWSPSSIVDLGLGEGRLAVEGRAAFDVQRGRFGIIGSAALTVLSGRSERMFETADWNTRNALSAAPLWHLSGPLAVHLAYSRQASELVTTDYVGGGVSYTSINDYTKGSRPLPIEVRYTHLEATRGTLGTPKFMRDQLEVRIYFRLFER